MHRDLGWFWEDLSACRGDLSRVLDLIVVRVAEVVGEGSMLTVSSDDGKELQPSALYHPDPDLRGVMRDTFAGRSVPIGQGVVGLVAADRQPVILSELDPRSLGAMVSDVSRSFVEHYPIRSIMVVPLVASGVVLGTLGAVRFSSEVPYSDGDLLVLEALAERAALAISDARRGVQPLGLSEYEAIFLHSLDGVLFTRPDGQILAANPAACEILQRSEAEICRVGRPGLLDEGDPRSQKLLAQRSLSGRSRGELPMRRGDGTTLTADVSSTIFSTSEGELRAVVIFRDVTQQVIQRELLKRRRAELERLSEEDPLTRLLNRRGFEAAARRTLLFALREEATLQLAFFDMDGLKGINDRFGHPAGDEAIKRMGSALAASVRGVDVVARLAGDEFVALLFGASDDEAREVIDRVAATLSATRDGAPECTFSVGIAERPPGSELTIDELLEKADRRMYHQKVRRQVDARRGEGGESLIVD